MEEEQKEQSEKTKVSIISKIKNIYEKDYKKLLIIPIILLILAILQISIQTINTGDFINKGVSLKGGITATIPTQEDVGLDKIEKELSSSFPENDISVRSLSKAASQIGVIIEIDIDPNNKEEVDSFLNKIGTYFNIKREQFTIEIIGSSLGRSFFREALTALILAFIFMAIAVFFYFKTLVPSATVVLCVLSDIIVTIATVNLIGIKLSTAGLAAFLMLIGYSVDTDMLLTARVLRGKEGTVLDRTYSSIKTGILMTTTTITAVTVGFIFTQSEVIKQIMLIVIIGMFADSIYTWIQNAAILRIYMYKKHKAL